MRRSVKLELLLVSVSAFFFLAPVVPRTTANLGGGPSYQAYVSPSFSLFQCGAFSGSPGFQVPSGTFAGPHPSPSPYAWDCAYPRL
jgi:hypothetical protein